MNADKIKYIQEKLASSQLPVKQLAVELIEWGKFNGVSEHLILRMCSSHKASTWAVSRSRPNSVAIEISTGTDRPSDEPDGDDKPKPIQTGKPVENPPTTVISQVLPYFLFGLVALSVGLFLYLLWPTSPEAAAGSIETKPDPELVERAEELKELPNNCIIVNNRKGVMLTESLPKALYEKFYEEHRLFLIETVLEGSPPPGKTMYQASLAFVGSKLSVWEEQCSCELSITCENGYNEF